MSQQTLALILAFVCGALTGATVMTVLALVFISWRKGVLRRQILGDQAQRDYFE